MAFAAVQIQPTLFRAALYEYLLGPADERTSPLVQTPQTGLLPTYRSASPSPVEHHQVGRFASYDRPGGSPGLYDVELSHTTEPADLADHQGRVILSNILSSVEGAFGRVGEYRMRATAYSTHDADTSALLSHVATMLAKGGTGDYPMAWQCFDSIADITRAGPEYQSGSGLWRGTVDFRVRLVTRKKNTR